MNFYNNTYPEYCDIDSPAKNLDVFILALINIMKSVDLLASPGIHTALDGRLGVVGGGFSI